MMRSRLIVKDGLAATQDGFSVEIRLPWYRTLPLSVIDMPVIKLDGAVVDPAAISLRVNGKSFDAESLRGAYDESWYVLDPGALHVVGHMLAQDEPHAITVEVHFAPPYIPEITLFCAATRTMTPSSAGVEA